MTPRIISLLPSATEIVCALGLRDFLVGRSHECDFPPGIEALPVCTEPKVRVDGTSEEIHASVESVLGSDISVYRVHAELLKNLKPTHIVTQIQCDVCAVSLRDVEAAVAGWSDDTTPALVTLNPSALSDVYDDIRRTASALGCPSQGQSLISTMDARLRFVQSRVQSAERPRVATIEWIAPLMAAGNWMPELIDAAGGQNLFGEAGRHSPWLEWSDLVAADPDVIVVMPCGFSVSRTQADMHLLTSRSEWQRQRAVRNRRVYIADGNQYFNRPGPRLADSVEILAEMLHPELFQPRYRNTAWIT